MSTNHAPRRYRDVLAVGEFRALLAAQAVSIGGSVVGTLALSALVFARTASPLLAALAFALGFAPALVSGLLFGGIVDRVPARRVAVGCDLLGAGAFLVLAIPGLPVAVLLAVLALTGLAVPLHSGAIATLLPEVLDDGDGFVLGRSLLRLAAQTMQILGFAVGGVVLLLATPRSALLLDAASFLAAALLVRLVVRARPEPTAADRDRWRPGDVRTTLADPTLRRLLAFGTLVPSLAVAPEAVAVPYVAALGAPSGAAGLLLSALPLGTVLGELLAARAAALRAHPGFVRGTAALVFLPQLALLLRPPVAIAALALVVSGMGFAHSLGFDRLLLTAAPPTLRGRTLTAASALLMGGQGLGFALAGAVAEVLGPHRAVGLLALIGLAGVALLAPTSSRTANE